MAISQPDETLRNQLLQLIPSGVGVYDVTGNEVRREYLNDGYFQMIGAKREQRRQYDGTGTIGAIHPADVPGLLSEAQAAIREGRMLHYCFRVLDGRGVYRYLAIQANHLPLTPETERFYAAYYDIDTLMRTQEQLKANELLYNDLLTYSEISHFVYFPHLHRYEAAILPEKLSRLPGAMDDFPESFIRYAGMSAADGERYREMIRRIDRGEQEAECTVQMRYENKYGWYRVHIHSFQSADGTPLRAVGTAINVTQYKEAEKAFLKEKLRMQSLKSGILAVSCFNVTQDSNVELNNDANLRYSPNYSEQTYREALEDEPEITAQHPETLAVLLCAAEQIPDREQRRHFVQTCSHAGMLRLYKSGEREAVLDYRRWTGQGLIWVSTRLVLLTDPDSRDLLGFFYTTDINERVIYRKLTERVLSQNYESVCYYDFRSRRFYCSTAGQPFVSADYDAAIEQALSELVLPAEADALREALRLPRLTAALEKEALVSVYFTGRQCSEQLPGRPHRRMKIDLFYLDEARDILVFLRIDATEMEETLRLRERAAALETAVRNIPAGLAVYKKEGERIRAVMLNDNLCRLVQASREEVLHTEFDVLLRRSVHPEDRAGVQAAIQAIFSGEGQTTYTYRTKIGDGDYLWIAASGQAVTEADGSKLAYVLYTDATEQKQREAEFDRRMREVTAANPNTLAVVHLNLTQNRYVEGQGRAGLPDCLEHFSTADGLLSHAFGRIYSQADRRRCMALANREALLKAFGAGQTDLSCEFRRLASPGDEVRWSTCYFYLAKNPRSGDVEAVACVMDTHEAVLRRRILARISGEDYDYFALLDVRTQALRFLDVLEGTPVPQPLRPLDYGAYLQTVLAALPEGEAPALAPALALDTVLRELEKDGCYLCPFSIRTGEGELRRKQLTFRYLEDSRESVLITREDLTAAYRQEQSQLHRMEEALALAEEASRAKTEFVSRISHDIRTPISIISSMTNFALEDAGSEEKLRGDLNKIKTANTFLLSLINDVLDISKIDSGKIKLNPEPYPYEEHAANIRNMLEPLCAQKGLTCTFQRRHKTGVIVADRVRLNQIILNLISNAVKYTPPGGTITYISDSEDLPDAKIRFGFELRDTGIGMSEEFQKIMFEPFSQEYDNPARPKGITGTGLGLSIVKKMVDLMGGTLTVESAPGRGTTVRGSIVFPDALRDPRYRAAAETAPPAAVAAVPLGGTVLLAEDNAVNAEIACRLLERFGLKADWAENGAEAVERFAASASGAYRAVLMDIQMPRMNGYEATAAIRALNRPDARQVPIIAMTADAFSEAVERSQAAGMNVHLTKPLEPALLYRVLAEYLPPLKP